MRNTITSLYQPSNVGSLIPTMQSYIESATRNLSRNQEEDITFSTFSLKLATDIIGQSAFGIDFGLSKEGSPDKPEEIDDEASAFIKEHVYSTTSLKMDLSGSLSIIIGLIIPILQEPLRQVLSKRLIARVTSQEVEVGGYLLPKGTWVWLAPVVVAKDPKNFPDPDAFLPSRFDPACEEEQQRHPYALIPFGALPYLRFPALP